MAQPTYYPDWATEDTTLPSTGQTNKVRPKNSLLTIGWDKGQIPSAEEFNWELNNLGQWIRYLNDEVIAGLPDVYLPKNGTQLTFEGDISGTATWNGDAVTSVTLSSATLNAATYNPTPNTLVKRDSGGGFGALQNFYGYAPAGQNFDYRIYDQAASNVQKASFAWDRSADVVTLYRGTPTAKTSEIVLYVGRVELTSPRSRSTQGTDNADLTRKDYVDGIKNTLQTNIDMVANDLSNFITTANNTYVKAIRLGTRGTIGVSGSLQDAPDGNVLVGGGDFGADDGSYAYRLLQYQINGTWYTASVT
ncbi:hypothetical protein EPNKCIFM_00082 [Klebsiella phage KP13-16]|nr:hypothetical protein EPNKCIFM_00082 [Klebsiella phage KP13-16]